MYVHCPLIIRIIKGLVIIPDAYHNIGLAFFTVSYTRSSVKAT